MKFLGFPRELPVGRTKDRLAVDHLVAQGVADQFGNGMKVELEHDVGAMGLRGFHADPEDDGDFLIALPFGEKLYDFALPGGQPASRDTLPRKALAGVLDRFGNCVRYARREARFVSTKRIYGGDQVTIRIVFQDVSMSACF